MNEANDDTAAQILDVAQELIQTRGYNAISYQDIADRVGIRKASIHHHFAGKSVLATALVQRYRAQWIGLLTAIDRGSKDPWEKLDRYIKPFRTTMSTADRACLCGMLGAEFASLEPLVQLEVQGFFKDNMRWLATLLRDGRKIGAFHFAGGPASEAGVLFGCLEGALLVARACGEPKQFEAVVRQLKTQLREQTK
ncbi:MAG TPA: TetR/AcrR family transcriptional regulator [Tepidisphaeraceae bacterium]